MSFVYAVREGQRVRAYIGYCASVVLGIDDNCALNSFARRLMPSLRLYGSTRYNSTVAWSHRGAR